MLDFPNRRPAARIAGVAAAAAAAAAAVAVAAAPAGASQTAQPSPSSVAQAHAFAGTPTVGALFPSSTSGAHFCTASVVDSPRGDVILTAAHCIRGTAKGLSFAPQWNDGNNARYGRWTVTGVYESPQWVTGQNTERDYALLTVADRTIGGKRRSLESLTGANGIATHVSAGARVTIDAYNDGAKAPITCTVPVYFDGVYPAFNCNPYEGGSSGSPWLEHTRHGNVVVGVIGGLHQGGCVNQTSYSAPFGTPFLRTLAAAQAGHDPVTSPQAGPDGCPA